MAETVTNKVKRAYEKALMSAGKLIIEPRTTGNESEHARAAVLATLKFEEVYGFEIRELRLQHQHASILKAMRKLGLQQPEEMHHA